MHGRGDPVNGDLASLFHEQVDGIVAFFLQGESHEEEAHVGTWIGLDSFACFETRDCRSLVCDTRLKYSVLLCPLASASSQQERWTRIDTRMASGLDPDIRLHGGVQFGILMRFPEDHDG